jgi:branched-chain amino acid transport system permease protein
MNALFQALASGFALGAIYGLVALGFNITYATTRTFNFGQGEFLALGSLVGVTALLFVAGKPHIGNLLPDEVTVLGYGSAAVLTIVGLGLVGVALYFGAVKPFLRQPGLNWVMSTIGFSIIIQNAALALWGPSPLAVPSPLGDGVYRVMGVGIRPQEILIAVTAIVVMIGLDLVLRRSRLGKALRAVAHSPLAAALVGIHVERIEILAFVISSCLAGLAGILIAPISTASAFIGLAITLKAFSAAIVGGLSSPRGCVIGGFILGLLEAVVGLWRAEWREITIFLLIILVLVVRPSGLFGTKAVEKI